MKRIKSLMSFAVVAALTLSMTFALTGCSSNETEESEDSPQTIAGSWTLERAETGTGLTSELQSQFDSAMKDYEEMKLETIAIIGTQVVAGSNYQILCRGTSPTDEEITGWVVATMYVDLDNNAEILNFEDFYLDDYVDAGTSENEDTEAENISGGWEVYSESEAGKLPEEAQTAWDAASDASGYTPLACLGSQLVSGMNYAILAVDSSSTPSLKVLTIYADLDGNAEITNTATVILDDFCGFDE